MPGRYSLWVVAAPGEELGRLDLSSFDTAPSLSATPVEVCCCAYCALGRFPQIACTFRDFRIVLSIAFPCLILASAPGLIGDSCQQVCVEFYCLPLPACFFGEFCGMEDCLCLELLRRCDWFDGDVCFDRLVPLAVREEACRL